MDKTTKVQKKNYHYHYSSWFQGGTYLNRKLSTRLHKTFRCSQAVLALMLCYLTSHNLTENFTAARKCKTAMQMLDERTYGKFNPQKKIKKKIPARGARMKTKFNVWNLNSTVSHFRLEAFENIRGEPVGSIRYRAGTGPFVPRAFLTGGMRSGGGIFVLDVLTSGSIWKSDAVALNII